MINRARLPWNDDDDTRLRLAYGKASYALIGEQLGRTARAVRIRSWRLNLYDAPKRPSRARYVAILTEECQAAGIDLAPALANARPRPFAYARFRAWARLRAQNFSLPGIGLCARVDHSTVNNGLKRAAEMAAAA